MKQRQHEEKETIGWREYVDLPDWGIRNIRAKIDTGARTSSLHVEDVRLLKNNRIVFYVVLSGKDPVKRKKVTAGRLKRGRVKSSTGEKTRRWYVKTKIRLGDFQREIVVNLIDRGEMNFRMLLGRTAIDEVFLVDADKSFILSRKKGIKK